MDYLGKSNYLEEANWFLSVVDLPRQTHINYLYSDTHFEKISHLISVDMQLLKSMTVQRFIPYFYSPQEILKLPIEKTNRSITYKWDESGRNKFLNGSRKVCPICLMNFEYFLLPWLLRPITTCPLHKSFLMDRCHLCGSPFDIRMKRCSVCRTSIAIDQSIYYDDLLTDSYSKKVWSSIGFIDKTNKPDLASSDNEPFPGMQPYAFFKFLWNMGSLLIEYDQKNQIFSQLNLSSQKKDNRRITLRETSSTDLHKIFLAAYQILVNYPQNLFLCLERIIKADTSRILTSKRHSFPYELRKAFNINEEAWIWRSFGEFLGLQSQPSYDYWKKFFDKEIFPDLRCPNSQIEDASENHQKLSPPTDQEETTTKLANKTSNLLSIEQASLFLEIKRGQLLKLITADIIHPEEKYSQDKRKKWEFDEKSLKLIG